MTTNIKTQSVSGSLLPRENLPNGIDVFGVKSGRTVKTASDNFAFKSDLSNLIGGMLPQGEVEDISDLPTTPFEAVIAPNGVRTGYAYIVTNSRDPEWGLSYIYVANIISISGVNTVNWNNTGLTAFPSDVLQRSQLSKRLKESKTVAPSEFAVVDALTVTPIAHQTPIVNRGNYLLTEDRAYDRCHIVGIDRSEASIREYITANGTFVAENSPYYRTAIKDIPTASRNVTVISFNTLTNAYPIAFYDAAGLPIFVPLKTAEGIPKTIPIPTLAKKYVVSQKTDLDFICEFAVVDAQVINENSISLLRNAETAQLTTLKKFPNVAWATPSTTLILSNKYIVKPDVYYSLYSENTPINALFPNAGYLNRSDGAFVSSSGSYYETTNFIPIENADKLKSITVSNTHDSVTAADIVIYDASYQKLVANEVSQLGVYATGIPAFYKLCRNKNLANSYTANLVFSTQNYDSSVFKHNQFINRSGVKTASMIGYFCSDPISVLGVKRIEISESHLSTSAADIVVFNDANVVVAFNQVGQKFTNVPVTGNYAILCYNVNIQFDYKATFYKGSVDVKTTSIANNSFGKWELLELGGNSIRTPRRLTNVIKSLVDKPSIYPGNTTPQAIYDVRTTIERCNINGSFEALTDNFSITLGKGYTRLNVTPALLTVYRVNDTLDGVVVLETYPITLSKNERFSLSIDKFTDGITLKFEKSDYKFEKTYLKKTSAALERLSLAWDQPFAHVLSGEAKIYNCTFLSNYLPKSPLTAFGNSLFEGSTSVQAGLDKRWIAILAAQIGVDRTVIIGKGGEAANSAFYSRFVIENSWFYSKYVMLGLGTNNLYSIADTNIYLNTMLALITHLKNNDQIPVLVTVAPRVDNHGLASQITETFCPADPDWNVTGKVINDFVRNSGEHYIDVHSVMTQLGLPDTLRPAFLYQKPDNSFDGVHFNVAGHAAVAAIISIDLPFLGDV